MEKIIQKMGIRVLQSGYARTAERVFHVYQFTALFVEGNYKDYGADGMLLFVTFLCMGDYTGMLFFL